MPRDTETPRDYRRLLVNVHQELSTWPLELEVPGGWSTTGFHGDLQACARFVTAQPDPSAREHPSDPMVGLSGQLMHAVEKWADRPALDTGVRTVSYRRLDRTCRSIAAALARHDVGPHEPVALRPTSPFGRLSGLAGLVVHGGLAVPAAAPTRVVIEDDGADVVVRMAGSAPEQTGRAAEVGRPIGVLSIADDSGADLLTVSDRAIRSQLATAAARCVRPGDRVGWATGGNTWRFPFTTWSALTRGACLVSATDARAAPTVVVTSPRAGTDLPSTVRVVISDDVLLLPEIRTRLQRRGVEVVEVWSSADLGGIIATRTDGERWWPVFPRTTYVLGAAFEPVPAGQVGHLYVGGAAVSPGVLHRPARTLSRYFPDPFAGDGSRMVAIGRRVVADEASNHTTFALRTPRGSPH